MEKEVFLGFRSKKGQAFLIGAVLLISILVAIVTISNDISTSGFSTLDIEADKIDVEAEKVMDYAMLNKNSGQKINSSAILNFTAETAESLDSQTEIYFIENSTYSGKTGPIECYEGRNPNELDNCQTYTKDGNIIANLNHSNQEINNSNYTFDKQQGKEFYFVIVREADGESHVVTN